MGIRKTIYVPSQKLWDSVVETAERLDRSASWVLMNAFKNSLGAAANVKPADPEKYESHKPKKRTDPKPLAQAGDDWSTVRAMPKPGKGTKK